jgi:hypothetical protein
MSKAVRDYDDGPDLATGLPCKTYSYLGEQGWAKHECRNRSMQ